MNAIVAVNSDWGIGCGGTQTIVIPDDRRRFLKLTSGGTVITGRRTFEDIGSPLPKRKNIVLTGNRKYTADGVIVKHSIDGVLDGIAGEPPEKVFIIGGESIYRLFLPMCAYAFVTKIEAAPTSDAFFPDLDRLPEWELVEQGPVREEFGVWSVKSGVDTEEEIEKDKNTVAGKLRYSFTLYMRNFVTGN